MNKCKWVVRPGTNNSFLAFTHCKPGFNYLSKVSKASQIKSVYNNHLCPICDRKIEINIELLEVNDDLPIQS